MKSREWITRIEEELATQKLELRELFKQVKATKTKLELFKAYQGVERAIRQLKKAKGDL